MEEESEILDSMDVEVESGEDNVSGDARPLPTDPLWTDYVMGHFVEEEMPGGHPNVSGLRRVVQLLVGDVVSSQCEIKQCPNPDNGERAVVEYTINVLDSGGGLWVYKDAADACKDNTDKLYGKYPTAMATTRAEARVLRKILNLRGMVAAEEINLDDEDGVITNSQQNFIDSLCKKLDVDVLKFVNSGKKQYSDVNKVPFSTAARMVRKLTELQQNKSEIKEDIRGYKEDWR